MRYLTVVQDSERRAAIDRMFRARLSWTLLGGVGLIGLTSGLDVGWRGALLAVAIAAFIWLNHPLVAWVLASRAGGRPGWEPMAIGFALRVVALVAVIAVAW
jgi:hypothetical protein